MESEGGEDWLGLRITAVEAGMACSAAIDELGRLWVWGKMQGTEDGARRGDGFLRKDSRTPRRVAFDDEWEWGENPGRIHSLSPSLFSPRHRADTLPVGASPVVIRSPLVPLSPAPRAVVAVSSGQAHLSLLTSDGRLWMLGLRGRGVLHDDSLETETTEQQQQQHRFPETYMQSAPMEVPPGPLSGQAVVSIRSSLHHSYALTADGLLFRWGWKGIVEPYDPLMDALGGAHKRREAVGESLPLFQDVAFGYAHVSGLMASASP